MNTNSKSLEKKYPLLVEHAGQPCKVKDYAEFPELKGDDKSRCFTCRFWEEVEAYANRQTAEVLDGLIEQAELVTVTVNRGTNTFPAVPLEEINHERNRV